MCINLKLNRGNQKSNLLLTFVIDAYEPNLTELKKNSSTSPSLVLRWKLKASSYHCLVDQPVSHSGHVRLYYIIIAIPPDVALEIKL